MKIIHKDIVHHSLAYITKHMYFDHFFNISCNIHYVSLISSMHNDVIMRICNEENLKRRRNLMYHENND